MSLYICMDGVYAFVGKTPKEAFATYRESTADHNSLDADALEWFIAEPGEINIKMTVKQTKDKEWSV